ncbi:hypothetical protein DL93DRAFT_1234104 [Clavulina sp. PMI_390]|nr:hypothetical protein DL93DRAFT_1234104 [Clavulina sp. PMI_390]
MSDSPITPKTKPRRTLQDPQTSKQATKRERRLLATLRRIPPTYQTDEISVALISTLYHATVHKDVQRMWNTYQEIVHNHPIGSALIPPRLLHSIVAALATSSPRNRKTFLRLLSVLSEMSSNACIIHQWEWNVLIHAAGSGFRRTTVGDYEAALGSAYDMMADSFSRQSQGPPETSSRNLDIVSFNTLLAIASRTGSVRTFRRTLDFMRTHGQAIKPDRITRLIMLTHSGRSGRMQDVPSHVLQLLEWEEGLGVDGTNALIWAYGRSGQLDVAREIYDRMRHYQPHSPTPAGPTAEPRTWEPNLRPSSGMENSTLSPSASRTIFSVPNIPSILSSITPDQITFRSLLQCLAYHGDFLNAITVFREFVDAQLGVSSPPHSTSKTSRSRRSFLPSRHFHLPTTIHIYRALFIGFNRFGVSSQSALSLPFQGSAPSNSQSIRSPPSSGTEGKASWLVSHLITPHLRRLDKQTSSSNSESIPIPAPPPLPRRLEVIEPDSYEQWTIENLEVIFDEFLNVPRLHPRNKIPNTQILSSQSQSKNTSSSSAQSSPPHSASSASPIFSSSFSPSDYSVATPELSSHLPGLDPPIIPPSIVYLALIAFARTTGNDRLILRDAWARMAEAFGLGFVEFPSSSPQLLLPDPASGSISYRKRRREEWEDNIFSEDPTSLGLSQLEAGEQNKGSIAPGWYRSEIGWRPRGRLKRLVEWIEAGG